MIETVQYKLGEIATFVNGRAYAMPEMLKEGKYRIVRVGNFTGKDEWYYSDMDLEPDKYCENGDLLYKWACTFGPEIWTEEKAIYHYHIWKVIPDGQYIDKDYLFYLLRSMTVQWLKAAHGSTMVHITKEIMENNIVTVPKDVTVQHAIAMRLKTIDSKISNNIAICSDLEALAKLIYDYWFVQFDFPDENGKPYKSSGGKMVWNEKLKREIPEGWEVKKTGEYIDITRGVSYLPTDVSDVPKEGYVALLKSNNLQNDHLVLSDVIYVPQNLVDKSQMLSNNSIFVTMSSGSTEHVGKTALIPFDTEYCFGAFCSKISINPSVRGFISMFFLSDYFKNLIHTLVIGTSIKNISNEHLLSNNIAVPNNEVLKAFEDKINPIFDKLGSIIKENLQLTSLRDFLLPMLMNGQVKIGE